MLRKSAFFFGLLAFALAPAGHAATLRGGDELTIPSGEWLADDVYVAGGTVRVFGLIDGDLVVTGGTVVVDGRVTGDLLALGGALVVRGQVDGSLRAAGGNVTVPGRVAEDAVIAAGNADLSGRIERDLAVFGGAVVLDGTVGGDALVRSGRLRLDENARVAGQLTDGTAAGAVISRNARVEGGVLRVAPTGPTSAERVYALLRLFFGLFLTGLVLRLLVPRFVDDTTDRLAYRPGGSLGVGLLSALFVPFVAVLTLGVGALVGGWWLGVILLGLFALGLLVGLVIAALQLGRWIAEALGRLVPDAAALAAGLLLLLLFGSVPTAGPVLLVLAALFGLGGELLGWLHLRRRVLGDNLPGDVPPRRPYGRRLMPPRTPTPA
jgi:cytoskeletal protein CcmA (bactofilin family)